jgi:hypothetical protein
MFSEEISTTRIASPSTVAHDRRHPATVALEADATGWAFADQIVRLAVVLALLVGVAVGLVIALGPSRRRDTR